MNKARQQKDRPQVDAGNLSLGHIEYDRADEKRKIQEEIEDFLTERQEKKSPPQEK